MNLHDLTPPLGANRKSKRRGIGIGSGNGKTAGKGHKGQKARAGRSVAPYFEGGQMPLSRRIPKRGFSNFRFAKNYQTLNVQDLEDRFDASANIGPDELYAKKLVQSASLPIKILGDGEISKSITVKANAFSESAKKKIEAAGGRAEVI